MGKKGTVLNTLRFMPIDYVLRVGRAGPGAGESTISVWYSSSPNSRERRCCWEANSPRMCLTSLSTGRVSTVHAFLLLEVGTERRY